MPHTQENSRHALSYHALLGLFTGAVWADDFQHVAPDSGILSHLLGKPLHVVRALGWVWQPFCSITKSRIFNLYDFTRLVLLHT